MTQKTKLRDNFNAQTIRQLRERVSDLCSRPDCRVLTRGASSEQEKSASIGVAAHITAAAPGSGAPRYDSSLSKEQRKHYNNGIWLCQSCSRLIDVDEERFPISLLEEWKKQAEEYSQGNIGKQIITKDESKKDALDMVIDHTLGGDHKALTTGVADMVNHYDRKLNYLDPRFNIKTDVIDGCITRLITPLSGNVQLSMHMPKVTGDEFNSKLIKLQKFGEEFEVSANDISITGSKLFEGISDSFSSGAKLKLVPSSKKVDCELFVLNEEIKQSLGKCNSKIIFAQDLMILKGVVLNKLIEFESLVNPHNTKSKFKYTFNSKEWIGKDISKIPFFPKLTKILPILKSNGSFIIELTDSNCNDIELGDCRGLTERTFIDQVCSLIEYVHMARVIAKKLNITLTYQYFNSSPEERRHMHDLYSLIELPLEVSGNEFDDNPKVGIGINELEQFNEKLDTDNYGDVLINEYIHLDKIMGQQIPPTLVRHELKNVKPKISHTINQQEQVTNPCIELQFGCDGSYCKFIVP